MCGPVPRRPTRASRRRSQPADRPPPHPTHTRRTLMSANATPAAVAPYAAAIHTVELDDFGASFRRAAPGLFTCPIDVDRLVTLDERDELRALLHVEREPRGRSRC